MSLVRVEENRLRSSHDRLLQRASAIAQLCKHGHVWDSGKGAEAGVVNASLVNIIDHDRVVNALIIVVERRPAVLRARCLISQVELLEW